MLAEARVSVDQLGDRIGCERGESFEGWVPALDAALPDARLDSDPSALVWWTARLGHFVGAYLVTAHGGIWFLDEDPDSTTFLRSVVGRFAGAAGGPRYDPFRIAATVFAEEVPLQETFSRIAAEIADDDGTLPP